MLDASKHENARFVENAYEWLARSEVFHQNQTAFERATGLTLNLIPAVGVSLEQVAGSGGERTDGDASPSFCALMARWSPNCLACLEEERRLISNASREPICFACFSGVMRAAVPVWVGEVLVALLQSGPILLERADPSSVARVGRQALRRGVAKKHLASLLQAYEATPVLPRSRNAAALQVLRVFAEYLASHAEREVGYDPAIELPVIDKAKRFIEAEFSRALPLSKVAQAVGLSAVYFSELFHRSTKETFTGYLARVRVERAKVLLNYPHLGVGEIAYKAGFQTLSQFNRTFRRLTGITPTTHRKEALCASGSLMTPAKTVQSLDVHNFSE